MKFWYHVSRFIKRVSDWFFPSLDVDKIFQAHKKQLDEVYDRHSERIAIMHEEQILLLQDLQEILDIEVALRQTAMLRLRAIEQIITDSSLAAPPMQVRAYVCATLARECVLFEKELREIHTENVAKRKTAEKALREKSRRVTVRNDALR